jgi:phosphatidylglycerol:prolipoprotein diacylglycerol transferase
MLVFPMINPIAFTIGPLKVHWYGLMYLFGFAMAFMLAHWRVTHYKLVWTSEQISDVIFYSALGVVLGGRIGYMLFYSFDQFITNPLFLFKLWQGGMSFHGGLIGVVLAIAIFSYKNHRPYLEISDFVAPLVPLGLAAGRAGNFINGELWGRQTDVPWAMIFPNSDGLPRHPSQLYELGLEGLALFIIVWWYASKPRLLGRVSAIFLIGYGFCRLIAEFFREPDLQLGFIAFNWITMGQLLSVPMLLVGFWLWWGSRCKPI